MSVMIMSFGGGVQSWGYAAMVARGGMPCPGFGVMINTGRECRSTWDYFEAHKNALPFPVHIVDIGTPEIFYENGKQDCLLPAYFTGGKLPVFCSGKWKRDEFRSYLRGIGIDDADVIFGISIDEFSRARTSGLKWLRNVYPLVDARITRGDCITAAVEFFGERPPRSRCWMCPNQNRDDWLSLPDDELEMAADVERQINARGLYLTRQCIPLRESVATMRYQLEFEFNDECDGGYCYV